MSKFKHGKHLREGDRVIAIAGNDKGKVGLILARSEMSAIVQGINMRKKHVKASQENPKGGVIEREMPMAISNLSLCPGDDKKGVRLKVRANKKGERELFYKAGDKEMVYRTVKKSSKK